MLALVPAAATAADYCGPDVQAFEQIGSAIAAIRLQIRNWAIDESVRDHAAPRCASGLRHPLLVQLDRRG